MLPELPILGMIASSEMREYACRNTVVRSIRTVVQQGF